VSVANHVIRSLLTYSSPYWKHCGNDNYTYGIFDPPGAVPPVVGLLPTTVAAPVISTYEPASPSPTTALPPVSTVPPALPGTSPLLANPGSPASTQSFTDTISLETIQSPSVPSTPGTLDSLALISLPSAPATAAAPNLPFFQVSVSIATSVAVSPIVALTPPQNGLVSLADPATPAIPSPPANPSTSGTSPSPASPIIPANSPHLVDSILSLPAVGSTTDANPPTSSNQLDPPPTAISNNQPDLSLTNPSIVLPTTAIAIVTVGSQTIGAIPGSPGVVLPNGSTVKADPIATVTDSNCQPVIVSVGTSGIYVAGTSQGDSTSYYANPTVPPIAIATVAGGVSKGGCTDLSRIHKSVT
jgi:hypothetical protein